MVIDMQKEHSWAGVDIIIYGIVTLVLICLRAADVIKWNWLWVLAPIWAPIAAGLIIVICILIWSFIEQKVKS